MEQNGECLMSYSSRGLVSNELGGLRMKQKGKQTVVQKTIKHKHSDDYVEYVVATA